MKSRRFALLALCAALLLPPKTANADINLFPPAPLSSILLADPGEYQSRVKFPDVLDEGLLQQPFSELAPYISLSKSLPLLSLDWRIDDPENFKVFVQHLPEDKVRREIKRVNEGKDMIDQLFSLSFVGSRLLDFPPDTSGKSNGIAEYKGKLEAFLTSPVINEYFLDGNRLYLAGGLEARGLVDLNKLESISSLAKFPPTDYRVFGDMYIVARSPWSEQFLIIKTGLDNLLDRNEETFNFSMTFEFPSIFYKEKVLKNFKISPYVSVFAKLPLTYGKVNTEAAEAGFKISGEREEPSAVLYGRAELTNGNSGNLSTGLKIGL